MPSSSVDRIADRDRAGATSSAPALPRTHDPRPDALLAPHRRYNPLTDEWVLVSADRTSRPWQGDRLPPVPEDRPAYDPDCYLCPGNARAGGVRNPGYGQTFVFTNDFAALRPDVGAERVQDGLLVAEGERGTCRVICYTPRHDLTMARLGPAAVRAVVTLWADQTVELGATYRWVQVFENCGAAMGASNPHPHGQIWAGSALPREVAREDAAQRRHLARTGRRLLLDYVAQEAGGPRVVHEDDDWLVVVPFWAAWPFETMIVAKARPGLGTLGHRRVMPLPRSSSACCRDTTISSSIRFPTRWAGTRPRSATIGPAAAIASTGSSTHTSIRHSCARPPFASSWSAMSSSPKPSATDPGAGRGAPETPTRPPLRGRGARHCGLSRPSHLALQARMTWLY